MENSVYQNNKGINRSIEFKGLKAQYIFYFAIGVLLLLILYASMYLLGVNTYVSLLVILMAGAAIIFKLYQMNRKYGEHGLMKAMAKKRIPSVIKCNSRAVFIHLKPKGKHDGKDNG